MEVKKKWDDVPNPFADGRATVPDFPREGDHPACIGVEGEPLKSALRVLELDGLECGASPFVLRGIIECNSKRKCRFVDMGSQRVLARRIVLHDECVVHSDVFDRIDFVRIP